MDLQSVWFVLWGLLWVLFFVTGGFDLGVGVAYFILGKSEEDKHYIIKSIGPLWGGNEVWLIAAGGITFAAFPRFYSILFSGFYFLFMAVLFALILRGVSFEFREKINNSIWKKIWDFVIFIGSFIPAFLFGLIFANIFKGVALGENGFIQGNCINFFSFYSILGGIFFTCLFFVHGLLWLSFRLTGKIQNKAKKLVFSIWPVLCGLFVIFLIFTSFLANSYGIYLKCFLMTAIGIVAICSFIMIRYYLMNDMYLKSWVASGTLIGSSVFFGMVGMFPNLLRSLVDNMYNVTIFNSSATSMSLKIMLVVAIIFIPIVIAYQIWAYTLFMDKIVKNDFINEYIY